MIAYSTERAATDASFHAIKVYGTRADISIRFRRGIDANSVTDKSRNALSFLTDALTGSREIDLLRAAGL